MRSWGGILGEDEEDAKSTEPMQTVDDDDKEGRDEMTSSTEDGDDEEEDEEVFINYPDIRVNDNWVIKAFPKKEIPGSGYHLAKCLGLLNPPPTSSTLPPQYFQCGQPQIGDVPRGFPSSFDDLTNEHIFWLVVFYNDSFALQARAGCPDFERRETANDHLFDVWWHLSWIATHEGEVPHIDDDEFWWVQEAREEAREAKERERLEKENESARVKQKLKGLIGLGALIVRSAIVI